MNEEKRKETIAKLKKEIQKYFKTLQEVILLERVENYEPKETVFPICKEKIKENWRELITIISELTVISLALEQLKQEENAVIIETKGNETCMYCEETRLVLKKLGIECEILDEKKDEITIWID